MDNLLPILLGLIFFGFKYYNKTQKEKKNELIDEQPQENFIEKAQTSFDDFMNEFIGENEQVYNPVTASPTYQKELEVEGENVHEETMDEWMQEMHEEEPDSIEYAPEVVKESSSDKLFESIQNKPMRTTESVDFDLRKAVIYDAILNPPYI